MLAPLLGSSQPFVIPSSSAFRPEGPPSLDSGEYTKDFLEIKRVGKIDSAYRTADQTEAARFWELSTYVVGSSPDSYDKQFVRDWLTRSGWDKESEPPALSDNVVAQTRERYLTAYHRLVGKPLFRPKARNE